MMPRSLDSRRAGFALLVSLLLLALVAVVMLNMTRLSLNTAVAALIAEDSLQERWGRWSLESLVLPRAEFLLAAEEKQIGKAVPRHEVKIQLGRLRFTAVVADEQAKLNLNLFFDPPTEQDAARQRIMALAGEMPDGLTLQLSPMDFSDASVARAAEATDESHRLAVIGSWAQVFGPASFHALYGFDAMRDDRPTDLLTCWGDGRLNLARAAPDAIRAVCGRVLDDEELDRLMVQLDQTQPGLLAAESPQPRAPDRASTSPLMDAVRASPLDRLLAELDLPESTRRNLGRLVTERSLCHSIAIRVQDGARQRGALTIRSMRGGDDGAGAKTVVERFIWD